MNLFTKYYFIICYYFFLQNIYLFNLQNINQNEVAYKEGNYFLLLNHNKGSLRFHQLYLFFTTTANHHVLKVIQLLEK